MFSAMVASLSGILEIPIYLNLLRALAQDGRSIGAGQHSKPKDRFLLVFSLPFLFFSAFPLSGLWPRLQQAKNAHARILEIIEKSRTLKLEAGSMDNLIFLKDLQSTF